MTPQELISETYSCDAMRPTVVTSSFGNYSAVLLHMVTRFEPNTLVLWVDTQFNLTTTLKFKQRLYERLNLNLVTYVGKPWVGEIPLVDSPEHDRFVEQVKLEPFRRAVNDIHPASWITGIRREQTDYRKTIQHVEKVDDLIKVCPLLDWTTAQLEAYIDLYDLPNESNYFDPTKIYDYRECGMHTTTLRLPHAS